MEHSRFLQIANISHGNSRRSTDGLVMWPTSVTRSHGKVQLSPSHPNAFEIFRNRYPTCSHIWSLRCISFYTTPISPLVSWVVAVSNIFFLMFIPKLGEDDSHFDIIFFSGGLFNHQLVILLSFLFKIVIFLWASYCCFGEGKVVAIVVWICSFCRSVGDATSGDTWGMNKTPLHMWLNTFWFATMEVVLLNLAG